VTALDVQHDASLEGLLAAVDVGLHDVLDAEEERQIRLGAPATLVRALRSAVASGGKRLRPTFSYWGHLSVDGRASAVDGVRLAVALELVHTFAIVHDDVMDGSDTRRGQPSVHTRFATSHDASALRGERRRYAEGMAVLVGDLAYALANRLVGGLPPQVQDVWHDMCGELVLGQYLDLAGAADGTRDVAYAARVASLKSGRYTVVRPLQLGAALAEGTPVTTRALAAYGEPLGEAFQLCDDLLGAFGDPMLTGKPAGADIVDGKPTVLLAILTSRAPASALELLAKVGTPEADDATVADVLDLAERTGARAAVEQRICEVVERARTAATHPALHECSRPALLALAEQAAWRVR
jgi:geranylgeranyl diphosphate synthase type I